MKKKTTQAGKTAKAGVTRTVQTADATGARLLESEAEKELKRKNHELSSFIETAAVGLHWVGPDGIIIWANDAEMRFLGYAREEYIGRHIAEFHVDQPVIQDILTRLTRGEKLRQVEARLKCKDGSIKHVLIDSSVLWEEGKFIHSQCFTLDVTERKRTEAALRETHGLLSSVMEGTRDLFISIDRDWRITYFNAVALKVMKRPREEVLGRVFWDVFPIYKGTEIETGMRTAMQERKSLRFETLGPISRQWFEISMYPIEGGLSIFGRNIDEQKQAEQALRTSEERLRFTLEATQVGQWELDMANGAAQRSLRHAQIFGYESAASAWSYETFLQHVHPDDRAHVDEKVQQSLSDGRPLEYECRIVRTDGALRWIWTKGVAFRSADGTPPRMSGIAMDITERKKMEEALRESEAGFRALAHAVPAIVWTAAPDGTITYANDQWYAYCGLAPEENAQQWPELVLHPDDRARCLAAWTQALQSGEDYEIEVRNRRHDGQFRWFITRAIAARDTAGRVLGWFGTTTDIHDLKMAEAALREGEARFRDMADHAPMMVWVTEPDGTCTFLSKSWYDFTGQTHAMGLAWGWFEAVHPDERINMRDTFDQANARQEPFRMEYRLRRKDGVYRWVLDAATPRFGPDGRYLGYIGSVIDITERKQAEQELLNSRRLESIGVLAGGIAHDFNNILTAILGNVSLAKLRSTHDPGTLEALSQAEQASVRARDLTQQLLTFSKGGAPIRKPGALGDLLRETAKFALSGSNARLALAIDDGLWPALFDPGQMSQVINNLLINAVQAMPGGGTIAIAAGNKYLGTANEQQLPAGRYIKVTVRDEGNGIPPDHIAHVFDPYFTTKQTGSGLGLATSYSIIKRHGGSIDVASQLDKGTTFTLYIPASHDGAPASAPAAPVIQPGHGRILLMDDEAEVRQVGKALLMELGYGVETAVDGAEAIALYREAMAAGTRFDIVILDLTVPGAMGGKECLERLHELDPRIRAVVSSGYSTDPVMAEFAAHGFAGVVAKPYQVHELSETVYKVLHLALD